MKGVGDDVSAGAREIERVGDEILADGRAGDERNLGSFRVDEFREELFRTVLKVAAVIGGGSAAGGLIVEILLHGAHSAGASGMPSSVVETDLGVDHREFVFVGQGRRIGAKP